MTEVFEIIRDRFKFAFLRRAMDNSVTLDDFMRRLGKEPSATQVRLFIDYKTLVGQRADSENRWVGERYLTRNDFDRLKHMRLRISSFMRNGKNVKIFRDKSGRFVSSKILG